MMIKKILMIVFLLFFSWGCMKTPQQNNNIVAGEDISYVKVE
ncbi:hypothetical protein [Sulfurospirillum sp. 1612]